MADKRITELNLHTSLTLSDVIPIVNSGETKKTTYGSLYYGIRDGLVSGSSQIDITQTQNYGDVMITGSISGSSLVFEKGDTTSFNIELSGSFITPSQTGSFVQSSYLSCFSSASQQLGTSGSAQPVTYTSVWVQNGISIVDGSKITFAKAGIYELKFVAQLGNYDNSVHEAIFWVKYNGNNFPNSATKIHLPTRKDSGDYSSQLLNVTILGNAQNNNDYIQLFWTGDNTNLWIIADPAYDTIPQTPSIIVSVTRVG